MNYKQRLKTNGKMESTLIKDNQCPNLMNLSCEGICPKNRFQWSAGLNLEKFNANIFESQLKFKRRLEFVKFGLRSTFSRNVMKNKQMKVLRLRKIV